MNKLKRTTTVSTKAQIPLTTFVDGKSMKNEVFKTKKKYYPHNSHPLLQLSIKI